MKISTILSELRLTFAELISANELLFQDIMLLEYLGSHSDTLVKRSEIHSKTPFYQQRAQLSIDRLVHKGLLIVPKRQGRFKHLGNTDRSIRVAEVWNAVLLRACIDESADGSVPEEKIAKLHKEVRSIFFSLLARKDRSFPRLEDILQLCVIDEIGGSTPQISRRLWIKCDTLRAQILKFERKGHLTIKRMQPAGVQSVTFPSLIAGGQRLLAKLNEKLSFNINEDTAP